jgi:putative hemolysin
MNLSIFIELVLLCQLLILSAFFSGTETALFSLSKLQVRRLRQEHPVVGAIVAELLEHPNRLLSTLLIGNTVVNIASATLGYLIIRQMHVTHAEVVAVPVMTVLLLLVGEITPKSLAIRNPEYYAHLLARPIRWLVGVSAMFRHLAEVASNAIVSRLERFPYFASRKARAGALTEDEYRTVLRMSEHAGVLRKEERAMVNKILALEQMPVKQIMTPRVDMQCIENDLSRDQAEATLRKIKHRRVPVIHGTPDTVVGILHVKDFLIHGGTALTDAMEQPHFVPETQTAARLLQEFRMREHPIAIVIDEYGGTAGLVTLEDVLEEIVGEIEDEFDASEVMVQKLDARHFLINGKAQITLVNEVCHVQLQTLESDTIAGWLMEKLGAMPREGDSVVEGTVQVAVRKVAKNRVREVLVITGGG